MTMPLSTMLTLAAQAGGAPAGAAAPDPMRGFFWMGLMVVLLILMFVWTSRSQKKRERRRQEMLDSIKPKDDVVTVGGIHGRVVQVKDDSVVLRIDSDKDIRITIAKGGISRKLGEPEEPA